MFILKIIAVLAMLIDHSAKAFEAHLSFETYMLMRTIGRIAFPLFAFCLAEGCRKTGDMKKFLLRLGIFALISEIPYDMLFAAEWGWSLNQFIAYYPSKLLGTLSDTALNNAIALPFSYYENNFYGFQNVFFTLFFGAMAIYFYKRYHEDGKRLKNIAIAIFVLALFGMPAELMRADYGILGVFAVFGC
jgi:hypothetical protein